MGLKLGRKAPEKGDRNLGTPALSEASYDEKHEKQDAKPQPEKKDAKGDVVPPVSFRSLFRYVQH